MSSIIRSVGYDPTVAGYPYSKRTVGVLSDGTCVAVIFDQNKSGLPAAAGGDATNVPKAYLYWSSDRVNWQLKATLQISAVAASAIVATMTIDALNNVHVVYRTSTNSLVYVKFTYAAGSVWTVGANETVQAPVANTNNLRLDIDSVGSTANVVIAAWAFSSTGPLQNYAKLYVRNNSNVWVAQTPFAILAAVPYNDQQDISVAVDSAGADGSNNIYYAVVCGSRRDSAGADNGDVIVMFKSNVVTGAYVSATIIQGSTGSTGFFKGAGAGVRKYWLFSSGAAEYTLVGHIGGPTFGVATYRWTYAAGVRVDLSPLQITPSSDAWTRFTSHEYATVTYAQDRAIIWVTNGNLLYAQLVLLTRGGSLTSVSLSPYYGPGDYNAALAGPGHAPPPVGQPVAVAYPYYLWGGNNRNFGKNKHDILYYNFGVNLSYEIDHTSIHAPSAPTAVVPSAGATVTNDRPTLQAEFRLSNYTPQTRAKMRWQIAADAGFISQLKDMTQPDTAFVAPVGTTSASVHSRASQVLDALNELHQTTWYIRAASILETGDQGPWTPATSFLVTHPPSPANVFPTNDKVFDYGASGQATFSWDFTDPSPTDAQTAYQIVIERNDTGATIVDTGKILSTAVTATLTIPTGGKDLQLRWKMRLWDSDDVVGNYSQYQTFYIADPPTVVITAPAPASTITTGNPTVAWTFTTGGGLTQTVFRVVILAAGVVIYDSGERSGSNTSWAIPVGFLKNTTQYTVMVFVRDNLNLTASTSSTFQTLWTPPAAPTFAVSSALYKSSGFIRLTWTSTVVDPNFIAYRVYSRIQGSTVWNFLTEVPILQPSYVYDDWLAGSGVTMEYAVTQVIDAFGSIVESVPVAQSTVGMSEYYWLISLTDSTKNFLLYNVTADSFDEEYEQETFHVIGRGRHVDYGDRLGYAGSLSAQLRDRTGLTARTQRQAIERLKADKQEMYLRNPFGDVWRVAASNISVSRIAGVATQEFVDVTIPYSEVGF